MRRVALLAGFALGLGLTSVGVVRALDASGIRVRPVPLDAMVSLDEVFAISRKHQTRSARVLFLGDSLLMDGKPPDTSIPARLQEILATGGTGKRPIRVQPVVGSGLGLFSHYFMSDRVVEARPDLVLVSLNLWSMSHWWRSLERAQISAWLPASRWSGAASLPLHEVGLSADRLLLYRAIVLAGGFDAWHWMQREQTRAARAYWRVAKWLQTRSGFEEGLGFTTAHRDAKVVRLFHRRGRASTSVIRQALLPVLGGLGASHPEIQVLDALLARLQEEGIPALVYAAPLNIEHLEEVGLYDTEGLARTIAVIDEVAARRGADFVDLHSVLPDAAFRDYIDHLKLEGKPDGTGLVAELIAPFVIDRIGAHRQPGG